MLRQSEQPIQFEKTLRMDNASILTSGKAGKVIPVTMIPLHRGDSCTGTLNFDLQLAEMPKPLENAVIARVQAWFIPRPALPQFTGLDEYTHSFHGKEITALNASNRTPPALFDTVAVGGLTALENSELFTALGLAVESGKEVNTDYIDAYNLVQNFRLASYSSKMTRYEYYAEDASDAVKLKPAFWPANRMHNIVPDYESALIKGSLELDVSAGQIPVKLNTTGNGTKVKIEDGAGIIREFDSSGNSLNTGGSVTGATQFFAEMAAETVVSSLADIDKARTTNAFAKIVAGMRGSDFSGFNNDDVIIAELMQGYSVPSELMNRPWALNSKTVVFGMNERHATDGANLEDSVTTGGARVGLSINVPAAEYGGVIMATVEIMPERLYERQKDVYLQVTDADDLPNAIRDIQRTEPVDTVENARIDTKHSTPDGVFGYEPMNAKWKRERTTMGGEFRQLTPGTPNVFARTAIWQADYVDPAFTSDHWLCPDPFPQDVFSVPANDCVNIGVMQNMTIRGHTQFGDELVEDNQDYTDVAAENTGA